MQDQTTKIANKNIKQRTLPCSRIIFISTMNSMIKCIVEIYLSFLFFFSLQLRALSLVRQKGPIEKEDPNAVRKKLSPKAKEEIIKKTEDSAKGMNKHWLVKAVFKKPLLLSFSYHLPAARVFYISVLFSNSHYIFSQCNTRLRLLYLLIKDFFLHCRKRWRQCRSRW